MCVCEAFADTANAICLKHKVISAVSPPLQTHLLAGCMCQHVWSQCTQCCMAQQKWMAEIFPPVVLPVPQKTYLSCIRYYRISVTQGWNKAQCGKLEFMEKLLILLSRIRPLRPESFRTLLSWQFCNLKPLELGLYFGATFSTDSKILRKAKTLIGQKKNTTQ